MRIAVVSQDIGFTAVTDDEHPGAIGTQFPGGSLWYRFLSPLKASGIEHHQGPLTVDKQRRRLGITRFVDGVDDFDFDVILLQRVVFPELPAAIRAAQAAGQTVINDMDDWFDGLPPTNNAFKAMSTTFSDGSPARTVYRKVLSASDGVICSTPFLADWYRRYAPTATWRNAMDFESFPIQHEQAVDHPKIGWFGSLRFRAMDIEQLRGVIGPFIDKHDLEFVHVGHEFGEWEEYRDEWNKKQTRVVNCDDDNDVARRTRMSPERLVREPPTSFIESSIKLHQYFDIGIAPLEQVRFNTAAKSALKGMEYAASGIPYVASPSDEYRHLLSVGIGRIAAKPREWQRHLTELLDYDVRVDEAERNRDLLFKHANIADKVDEWVSVVKGWMR